MLQTSDPFRFIERLDSAIAGKFFGIRDIAGRFSSRLERIKFVFTRLFVTICVSFFCGVNLVE